MDFGTVRIDTPIQEERSAAFMRSSCPREIKEMEPESFFGYLQGFFQIRDIFGRSLGSLQG